MSLAELFCLVRKRHHAVTAWHTQYALLSSSVSFCIVQLAMHTASLTMHAAAHMDMHWYPPLTNSYNPVRAKDVPVASLEPSRQKRRSDPEFACTRGAAAAAIC